MGWMSRLKSGGVARANGAQRNAMNRVAMAVGRLMGIGIGTTGFAGVVLIKIGWHGQAYSLARGVRKRRRPRAKEYLCPCHPAQAFLWYEHEAAEFLGVAEVELAVGVGGVAPVCGGDLGSA